MLRNKFFVCVFILQHISSFPHIEEHKRAVARQLLSYLAHKKYFMLTVHHNDTFRIFLIEDSPAEVRLIQEAAKEAGISDSIEFEYAYDGEEASELFDTSKLTNKKYDLVLLDLNLPRVTGIEVLEKVKTDIELQNTPVIVVTNSDYKKDMIDCYRLGADGYFQKPADFKKLVDFFLSVRESIRVRNKLSVFYIEKTYYDELALAS